MIRRRTAIMIVHGIGEQLPYETLDGFARGFISSLNDQNRETYRYYHLTRTGAGAEQQWCDSFVRIAACNKKGCDHRTKQDCDQPENHVDMHEYYWADATEEKIDTPEIGTWIRTTLKGAKDHFKSDIGLQQEYAERTDGKAYTHKLRSLLKRAYWVYKCCGFLIKVGMRTPGVKTVLETTCLAIAPVMCEYLGDVAIYTTTDRKSKFFGIREKILSGAQRKLTELLKSNEYDRVILAGHSLGSVVSYDLLNRVNILCNHDKDLRTIARTKLKAFITFGSPLDKIAFFFREMAEEKEYIRRQILAHMHSFKAVKYDLALDNEPGVRWKMNNSIEKYLDHVPWLNFYHDADPVSGHLDFYRGLTNIKIPVFEDKKSNRWGHAHLGYWDHQPMYKKIIDEYLVE